jgi:hypothetical protein
MGQQLAYSNLATNPLRTVINKACLKGLGVANEFLLNDNDLASYPSPLYF